MSWLDPRPTLICRVDFENVVVTTMMVPQPTALQPIMLEISFLMEYCPDESVFFITKRNPFG